MSHPKVGTTKKSLLLSLFSLTLPFILAVSAQAVTYQYALNCTSCHAMPPIDSNNSLTPAIKARFRDWSSGAFAGNHQTHTPIAPAAVTANHCVKCHNNNAYTIEHYNGVINMAAKIHNYSASGRGLARYNKPLFFNQTSRPNLTTCSNVNCHFETVTPAWGSTRLGNGNTDCETCHQTYPTPGMSPQSTTGHSTHLKYPSMGSVFSCDVCHVNHLFEALPYQHATSAGSRGVYVNTSYRYSAPTNDVMPSMKNVFGKCSNTYCHSNGSPAPATQGYTTVPYRMYSSPVFGTSVGCGACHQASPTTNAHDFHVITKGYACVNCHAATVDVNNQIIINASTGTFHVNNAKEVLFSGLAGTGSTCSTSYCHSTMTGTATTPVWTAQNSAPCGSCHFATNATVASKAHGPHLNSASYAYGPTALQGTAAVGSCQACHTSYQNSASPTHVNGIVESGGCTPCHVTAPTWILGRLSCESCHTGTSRSMIQGVTAPDMSLSASKGHTQPTYTAVPTCNSCHNPNSAHISGKLGDNVRLTLANDNNQCASCHNTGKTVARFQNMSTHFTTKGGPQNMLCKQCHDPHGTTNLSMIRTQIKAPWSNITTWTITYTNRTLGLIDTTTNRGFCQVCHSKTNHYKAGVPEGTNHHTSGCLDCHTHNSAGGAFKPTGGGSCNSCHGYPPLPKNVIGLTFGTAGNFADGRFEDYSGGGGAHFVPAHVKATVVASEGWANCGTCHNGGNSHTMLTPVKTNIANVTVKVDQKYRFSDGVMITYTGAKLTPANNRTGTCTNVECHFQPSRRWSNQR